MQKLFGRVVLTLSLSASAIALAAPAKCPIEGDLEEWIADFCMYSARTDDLAHPDVVACMRKQPKVHAARACAAKRKYKAKICNIVVRGGFYQGSVKQCLEDGSFSGPAVRGQL